MTGTLGAFGALVAHVHVGGPSGPPTATPSAAVAVATYAAVIGASLAAGPLMTRTTTARLWRASTTLALLAVAVVLATSGEAWDTVVLTSVHLIAVTVWLGGVVHLVVRRPAPVRAAIATFTPWAVGSAVAVAATGTVLAIGDRVGLHALVSTTFGVIVLVKAALVVGAAGLGLSHRFGRRGRLQVLVRVEFAVLAAALGFGAALVSLPAILPVVTPLGPGLSAIRIGPAGTATFFTASVRGRDSILLLSDQTLGVQDPRNGSTFELAPGNSLTVAERGPHVRLRLFSGASVVDVTLPAQRVAALPAGGLDALLAQDLAVGTRPRTVGACSPQAASTGRAAGLLLRARRVINVSTVVDGTPATTAFIAGVRAAGVGTTAPTARTLLVATDKDRALQVLAKLGGTSAYDVVVLAPWLLDRDVLATVTAHRLPPVLVAARSDAMAPIADRYRAALAALGDGLAPSATGLDAYAGAAGADGNRWLSLYAATPIGFLPGALESGHTGSSSSWLPGGSLVAVSHPTPVTCTASFDDRN